MPELSTAAQAILDAYWTYPWDPARQHEDRGSIAAVLRAAASQIRAMYESEGYVDPPDDWLDNIAAELDSATSGKDFDD